MARLKVGKKLCFSVMAFAALAIIAEILLRIFRPELVVFANTWFHLYTYDRHMEWDLEPDRQVEFIIPTALGNERLRFHVATDEHGLRTSTHRISGRKPPLDPSESPRMVHCIGDSYTMGWGVEVEDSYPSLLAEQLGPAYSVVNVGMAGAGLLTSIERSRRTAKDFPPTTIIYLYNMTDYSDDERCATRRKEHGGRSWPYLQPLCRSSFLFSSPAALLMWHNLSSVGASLTNGIPEKLSPQTMDAIDRMLVAASYDVPDDNEPVLIALKQFHEECTANGIRFILLIYDCDLVLAPKVVRAAREAGIESMTFFFGREFLLPDAHFNAAGNRRLAERVKETFFATSEKP